MDLTPTFGYDILLAYTRASETSLKYPVAGQLWGTSGCVLNLVAEWSGHYLIQILTLNSAKRNMTGIVLPLDDTFASIFHIGFDWQSQLKHRITRMEQ